MFRENVGFDKTGKHVGHATLERNNLGIVQDMQCGIPIIGFLYSFTT